MQQSSREQSSSTKNRFYRKLTSIDVDQALYALTTNNQQSITTVQSEEKYDKSLKMKQCDCCRFIRRFSSSRSLLPLARRGRPHISNRSHRLLCSNCTEIKHQLQIDILKTEQTHLPTQHINISTKTSTLVENTIDLSSNLNHLTDDEKKILLNEMIQKLQIVLNNHPTINNYNQNNFQFIYRTLQSTLSLLSSSNDLM